MGLENLQRKLAAAALGGSSAAIRADAAQRLQRSCIGSAATSASISDCIPSDSANHAEVAEVSDSLTHAQAHARTRARTVALDTGPLQPMQPLHVPAPSLKVTVLKHCRCQDCRKFSREGNEYFCSEYIGGTCVTWATGEKRCDPPPDAWHYCACYHGPQISKDVWVWPRHGSVEVATGPSSPPVAEYRGGNGTPAGLFRSTAHTQGKEA